MAVEYDNLNGSDIVEHLKSGKFMMVNRCKRNGLILFKRYHAEFAGPGAAVGGNCDLDCEKAIPVGNLSLIVPENYEERQTAYKIRIQWIRFIKKSTEHEEPLQRAQKLIAQFENFFDLPTIYQLPDEAFAHLVGVLPQTIGMVRRNNQL